MQATHSAAYAAALQELIDAPLEGAFDVMGGATFLPAVLPTDIATIRALWAHASPPIELLDSVFLSAQRTGAIPRRVADVVQLATLAVAINRCNFHVPQTEQSAFHAFFESAMKEAWLDEELRELLDDGLSAVTAEEFESNLNKLLPPTQAPAGAPRTTMHGVLSEMARDHAAQQCPQKRSAYRMVRLAAAVLAVAAITWSAIELAGHLPERNDAVQVVPRFMGSVEPSNGQTITGWAWDRENPNTPVQVEISDGVEKTTLRADAPRPELKSAGLGNGNHGFTYEIPPTRRDGRTYTVTVSVAGAGVQLTDSPVAVTYR